MADARQEERVRRKTQLEEHLLEVGKLLAKVDAQLLVEHDHDMFALGERVRKHEKEARALLAKLNKAETFIDKIVNPSQYAKAVKQFEGTLDMHDRNYDYLTKQRKDHEKTFIAQVSKNANKIKHMKSSPAVGSSKTNYLTSDLTIPSQHDRFQRSFEDLKTTYAENVDEKKAGYFRGPGSKFHLKKNPNMSPTSSGVAQGVSVSPSLPVPDNGGLQNSISGLPVVNEDNNTDTSESKWTPGAPILRPESLAILEKQWEEEDRQAAVQKAQLQAASGQAGTSSTYQSYAHVQEEYDMYNPPPRQPTPTIDPPSLPPPPRPRRRPTAIVTETDSQEDECGASSSNKGKGKSPAQSPTSPYNSPLTPSEVTENIFGPQTFTRPGGEDAHRPTGILKVKPINEDDREEPPEKKPTEDE